MATLTTAQVYALARQAGLAPAAAVTATAIAMAESGLRTDAIGDVALENATWGPSVGLWQIRSVKAQTGTGQPRDASRLTDPQFNAASMASLSGAGKSFSAWSTYTSGAYKKDLAAVSSATGVQADASNPSAGLWGRLIGGSLWDALTGSTESSQQVATNAGASAGGTAGGVVDAVTGLPAEALSLGVKLLATGCAVALFVIGAQRTVSAKD